MVEVKFGVSNEQPLVAFPNPVRDFMEIRATQTLESNYQLELIDLTGRTLGQLPFASNDNFLRINLQQIPSGIYFLKATNDFGTYNLQRIVKN